MAQFTKDKENLLWKTLNQYDAASPVTLAQILEDKEEDRSERTFLLHILIETLCSMLEKNEDRRQQLFENICNNLVQAKHLDTGIPINGLDEVRRRYAKKFYEHIKEVHSALTPSPLEELEYNVPEQSLTIPKGPKYKEVFDEVEIIACGGFGTVCKARHRIDGVVYAVKKIIFKYQRDSDYNKVMREAKSIAALSHCNVVGYKNAWVQPVDQFSQECTESNLETSSSSDSSDGETNSFTKESKSWGLSTDESKSSLEFNHSDSIIFCAEDGVDVSMTSQSKISYHKDYWSSKSYNSSNLSSSTASWSSSKVSKKDSFKETEPHFYIGEAGDASKIVLRRNQSVSNIVVKMMLCIQMEFCDSDLRFWLDQRNRGGALPFVKNEVDIFREILSGVEYIHSKSVIHRDLKPQNIFFSTNDRVMKIGDFGLATLGSSTPVIRKGHSTNLGTLPYAAPEQRRNSSYDSKVDMYSLGIILIELLVPIETKMEFSRVIDDIKRGSPPKEMIQMWPGYVALVRNLVQNSPANRMTAKEVLKMPLLQVDRKEDLENKVKELEEALARKDELLQEALERIRVLSVARNS